MKTATLNHDQHPCIFCPAQFGLKKEQADHLATFHKARSPWLCTVCPTSFGDRDGLTEHVREAHPTENNGRGFSCFDRNCGPPLASHEEFQRHKKHDHSEHAMLGERKCMKSGCSYSNDSYVGMNLHVLHVHSPTCSTCGKKFAKMMDLIEHEKGKGCQSQEVVAVDTASSRESTDSHEAGKGNASKSTGEWSDELPELPHESSDFLDNWNGFDIDSPDDEELSNNAKIRDVTAAIRLSGSDSGYDTSFQRDESSTEAALRSSSDESRGEVTLTTELDEFYSWYESEYGPLPPAKGYGPTLPTMQDQEPDLFTKPAALVQQKTIVQEAPRTEPYAFGSVGGARPAYSFDSARSMDATTIDPRKLGQEAVASQPIQLQQAHTPAASHYAFQRYTQESAQPYQQQPAQRQLHPQYQQYPLYQQQMKHLQETQSRRQAQYQQHGQNQRSTQHRQATQYQQPAQYQQTNKDRQVPSQATGSHRNPGLGQAPKQPIAPAQIPKTTLKSKQLPPLPQSIYAHGFTPADFDPNTTYIRRATARDKLRPFPPDLPEEHIFNADPIQIAYSNLLMIATRHSNKEIFVKVNEGRPEKVLKSPQVVESRVRKALQDKAGCDHGPKYEAVQLWFKGKRESRGIPYHFRRDEERRGSREISNGFKKNRGKRRRDEDDEDNVEETDGGLERGKRARTVYGAPSPTTASTETMHQVPRIPVQQAQSAMPRYPDPYGLARDFYQQHVGNLNQNPQLPPTRAPQRQQFQESMPGLNDDRTRSTESPAWDSGFDEGLDDDVEETLRKAFSEEKYDGVGL